jgi:hypothetical protein
MERHARPAATFLVLDCKILTLDPRALVPQSVWHSRQLHDS